MDEFGRPADQAAQEQDQREAHQPTTHDETPLPVRNYPPPLSPAPFSHYAATDEKIVSLVPNGRPPMNQGRLDDDAGCCKCVIM
jgi:hypothetical protein